MPSLHAPACSSLARFLSPSPGRLSSGSADVNIVISLAAAGGPITMVGKLSLPFLGEGEYPIPSIIVRAAAVGGWNVARDSKLALLRIQGGYSVPQLRTLSH